MESRDIEIRRHFHKKRLQHFHDCPNTIVIDELGIAHGKNRADIAVLNGTFHCFEIKSSKDTINRLPEQLSEYSKCFEKISVISAPNHIQKIMTILPSWCGLIVATKGAKGAVAFKTIKRPKKNPQLEITAMAHFLWRREIIELLTVLGVEEKHLNQSREKLYQLIPPTLTAQELTQWIKVKFMGRKDWRAASQQMLCDD
ncbi:MULTISPECIES: sce7726 family protein [unclassified Pseudomonas]|uniref:sce7726 family protein n=1 Tax=unclassified Pseudomonas TaxID=196821 RepID=UPI0012FD202C|nr:MULTISPECIES: sce7726 family protein [unclassified Pseudomonas]MCU1741756.1 sce7726 family protein [Pseudomonas sp. 20S_6.2_Bac1]